MTPDMSRTLDALQELRTLYGWGVLTQVMCRTARTDAQLWKLEKYLVSRLERVGLAAPRDDLNDDLLPDPTDELDYLHELTQPDLGENGAG